ncbi:hypothetical protein EJ04DRAFT_530016 [Polyplosphaeria fusca]|uniref:Uncharacterized protein n=1 Tax=Polyplosphaeria fusca TaxID=682080 RepID=A0A9P4QGA3_9PLEO|nr:hypothetical protein EJ04DRAFT_530016 [Polyplosphaeria fusca]
MAEMATISNRSSPGNIIVLHLTMIGVCFMIKSLHVFVFAYNYHKHRMSGANNLTCCMLLGLATLLILRSASSKAATKTSNDIFLASILMQYVCILAFIWESLQSLYHRTRAPSSSVGPVLESGGDPVMDLP